MEISLRKKLECREKNKKPATNGRKPFKGKLDEERFFKQVSSQIMATREELSHADEKKENKKCGRRGGSVVSASDLGPESREFEPWWVQPR